ncbi:hypothetical protein ACN28S_15780 [Cystobacter fuscus]
MKRYFGFIVLIVGVILAAVVTTRASSARALEAQRDADFARVQKDYLERVGWLRVNPDEKAYRQELAPFFKAYFTQVDAHQDRYKLGKTYDAYLAELEKRGDKDDRVQDRKAFYEYTRRCSTGCARASTSRCGRRRTRACAWTWCPRTW